jgi:hypothetical protein
MATYHHAQLGELVARVEEAVDRSRAGELDAFDLDQVLFRTPGRRRRCGDSCNSPHVEVAAALIRDWAPPDSGNAELHEAAMTGGSAAATPTHLPPCGR